ncbi:MAG: VCBS repeat-containing protein, partial [Bacteroidales bacterium]|nr:VCBS repeat-containing protein [Bacteroidales bacterium]
MRNITLSLGLLGLLLGAIAVNAQTNCVNFNLSQEDIGMDSETFCVSLADFDGDGWKDVVAIHAYDVIEVYFNNGDGTFNTTPDTYGDDSWRFGVEVIDIENDGDWDFITGPQSSSFGNGMEIWRNNGSGNFTLKGTFLGNA